MDEITVNRPTPVYSVSQLNRETKRLLGEHFLTVLVEGEISNLSAPSSGHLYFSLKDTQAQIRCALFKGARQQLRFKPLDGALVRVAAQVSLYEPRGDYQLIVEQMELAGDGQLRQAFEQLKRKLQAEGLFAIERKRPIPTLPNRIGIITSPSGAAIHDMLTVLKRRFPAVPIIIYPVAVQGEQAKHDITAALSLANQQALTDVLIVARGGGSLEDLWAFNEEQVARAIAASLIPVISAVGHEVDFTIADFVADLRAPTPSAAAERAVPDQQQWLSVLQRNERLLLQRIQTCLSRHRQTLNWLEKSLHHQHPGQKLQRNAQHLDELENRLHRNLQLHMQHRRHRLSILERQLERYNPMTEVIRQQQALTYLAERLQRAFHIKLERLRQQHNAIAQTLHAVSPLATLDRGYAIVRLTSEQTLVKSVKQLAVGDRMETRFAEGRTVSQIITIQTETN